MALDAWASYLNSWLRFKHITEALLSHFGCADDDLHGRCGAIIGLHMNCNCNGLHRVAACLLVSACRDDRIRHH